MKAIYINAKERRVQELNLNLVPDSVEYLEKLQELVGGYVEVVGCIQHDEEVHNFLYVNEEALVKTPQPNYGFIIKVKGVEANILGNGVIVGCDASGGAVDATVTVDYVKSIATCVLITTMILNTGDPNLN